MVSCIVCLELFCIPYFSFFSSPHPLLPSLFPSSCVPFSSPPLLSHRLPSSPIDSPPLLSSLLPSLSISLISSQLQNGVCSVSSLVCLYLSVFRFVSIFCLSFSSSLRLFSLSLLSLSLSVPLLYPSKTLFVCISQMHQKASQRELGTRVPNTTFKVSLSFSLYPHSSTTLSLSLFLVDYLISCFPSPFLLLLLSPPPPPNRE